MKSTVELIVEGRVDRHHKRPMKPIRIYWLSFLFVGWLSTVALLAGAPKTDVDRMKDQHALLHAVETGDKKGVQALLQDGVDPCFEGDAPGSREGQTRPLFLAARKGHAEIVTLLLEKDKSYKDLALWLAADEGQLGSVKALIEAGADVDVKLDLKSADQMCALMMAVKKKSSGVVKTLLEAGAGTKLKNGKRETALVIAAAQGSSDLVALLKQAELDEDLRNAASKGQTEILRELLSRGASLETRSKAGATPLMLAAVQGKQDTVEALLEKGANVNARNKIGSTALMYVAGRGHASIAKVLLDKRADVNATDNQKDTAWRGAVYAGHQEIAQMLKAAGANDSMDALAAAAMGDLALVSDFVKTGGADVRDARGRTPLMKAAGRGHTQVVSFLIDQGADVNAKTTSGWTSLLNAAKEGQKDVVSILLQKGANIEAKDDLDERTSLSWAAAEGHVEVVAILLDRGADFEADDKAGYTPLLQAVANGHESVARALLEKGGFSWHYNYRLLRLAVGRRDAVLVKLLFDHGAVASEKEVMCAEAAGDDAILRLFRQKQKDQSLEAAVRARDAARIDSLLEGGADPNSGILAVGYDGDVAMIQKLLAKGANVNAARRTNGFTVLMGAVRNLEVVKLLLAKGADPNAKMKDGSTATRRACYIGENKVVEVLKSSGAKDEIDLCMAAGIGDVAKANSLLGKGVAVNERDGEGNTALMIAAENVQGDIVRILLQKGADVNAQNKEGDTALMRAASAYAGSEDEESKDKKTTPTARRKNIVQLAQAIINALPDKEAGLNIADEWGETCLSVVEKCKDKELAEILKKAGARVRGIARNSEEKPSAPFPGEKRPPDRAEDGLRLELEKLLGEAKTRGEMNHGVFGNAGDFETAWIESVLPAVSNSVRVVSYKSALTIEQKSDGLKVECGTDSKPSRIAVGPELTHTLAPKSKNLLLKLDDGTIRVQGEDGAPIYMLMVAKPSADLARLNGQSVSDLRFVGRFASWMKIQDSGTLFFNDVAAVGFSVTNVWHVQSTSAEEVLRPLREKQIKAQVEKNAREEEHKKTMAAAEIKRKADVAREALERDAQATKDADEKVRKIVQEVGPKPENSAWDASVIEVKLYLDKVLKDPDSVKYIDWYKPQLIELDKKWYWAVKVRYRAKNSFGAYGIEEGTALIRDKEVIKFVPSSPEE